MSEEAAQALFQRLEAQGQAILQLAADMKEMRAKMSVEPLPGQGVGGGWKEVIGNIANAFAQAAASLRGGGGDTEKMLADLAIQSLRDNQIVVRSIISRVAAGAIPATHVVATG